MPQRVHDAERRIAFGDGVHEHARRADVHELIEGELLRLHLAPDAVDVLWPALDLRLDAGGAQFALQQLFQLFDVAFALGAAHLQRGRNVLVLGRLQIAKRQILQLPLHLPYAEPVGERRIDFAGLDGELAPGAPRRADLAERILCNCAASLTTTRRTSPTTATSIFRSASACAGLQATLRSPIGRQAELAQLTRARASRIASSPKQLPGALAVEQLVIEQRLQHRGDDHVFVGIERAYDFGDLERHAARGLGRGGQVERAHGREARLQSAARGSGRCGGFHES